MGTKAERSERTRAELMRVARELFAARGYAAVGTEEIVAAAGVTRGAMYHHFTDKRALFRAVHEALEEELVGELAERLGEISDPEEILEVGVRAFLDACIDRPRVQITLLDAPTVLGWALWREIDEQYGLGLISALLAQQMESGAMRRQPIRPLAHLLIGALGEAALLIANDPDPHRARGEVEPALLSLVSGLLEPGR